MTRADAEAFADSYKSVDIMLDDPNWDPGFDSLCRLWNDARGEGLLPRRQDIDLVEVPLLVPFVQIYQLDGPADDVNIEVIFQGSELAYHTREETGRLDYTDDYWDKRTRAIFLSYFNFVVRWPQPVWVDGNLAAWRRLHYRKEKFISLPFTSCGTAISGVITASHFYCPRSIQEQSLADHRPR